MTSETETATDNTQNNTEKPVETPTSPPAASPTAEATVAAPTAAPVNNRPSVHKTDYERDVVYLYQFTRCPTLPGISPFCLKVETWLRMTQLKYENVDHKLKFKSKKGQLPFVELNGEEIADSDIIIKQLSKHFEKDVDAGLTTEQRNVSHAFCSMLNNHTGWVSRCWRYRHPGQFLKAAQMDVKRMLNSKLPKGVLQFFFKLAFKSNVQQTIGHGLGRHTTEEILEFGKEDLKNMSQYLGEKQFFFGSEPHLLDCVAFSHLCQFIYVPFEGIVQFMEQECPNLLAFVNRMKERYWPDWDEICQTLELNTHLPKKQVEEDKKQQQEEVKKEEVEENKKEPESKEDKEKPVVEVEEKVEEKVVVREVVKEVVVIKEEIVKQEVVKEETAQEAVEAKE
ncbi:failed axon connections-like [Ornithodoros turicata]|uniref:Putative failed axon connections fax protein/glutathione s-transferase-like protein n=1 Tax=Ornithodoros turicata TaxID=34597 RepID=A0A2R5LND2_9ACAR